MKDLLAKMAGLLQDIYDEGHGGEFRPSIQEVLVKYTAAQQSAQADKDEEIDPVAQALRNLGDAIAPPRR